MRSKNIVVGVVVAISVPALAQEGPAKSETRTPCFELVMMQNSIAYGPILVNRCTGATWMLVRESLPRAKGNSEEPFTYRWHPLATEENEAILGYPALKLPRPPPTAPFNPDVLKPSR